MEADIDESVRTYLPSLLNGGAGTAQALWAKLKSIFSNTAQTLPTSSCLSGFDSEELEDMESEVALSTIERDDEPAEEQPTPPKPEKTVYDIPKLLELGKLSAAAPLPVTFSNDATIRKSFFRLRT